ncbi:MAG: GAF domain-containing protein [Terriglobales bacterium]|jgi:hypothetical protein
MDRSSEALQRPLPVSPNGDRRGRIRHKLHTPVFASFNGPQTGMTVDLSELVDLNEGGFCVQTGVQSVPLPSAPLPSIGLGSTDLRSGDGLEVNHPVTICLDLPETKSYIHGSGLVVWRDNTGRAGIRFSFLADRAMVALKEWLFVNLLIGTANHDTRAEQLERYRQDEADATDESCATAITAVLLASKNLASSDRSPVFPGLDSLGNLFPQISAQEEQETIDRPIKTPQADVREEAGRSTETAPLDISHAASSEVQIEDRDQTALQSIADRALTLTGASGSALALLTDGRLVCRARAGDPAPLLGSVVNVESGLSGECLRSGQSALCEDTATDPRVDSELCRAIGIASFVATPILSDFQAIGLLEVFSPQPRKFSSAEAEILEHLADLASVANPAIPETNKGVTPEANAATNTSELDDWDLPIPDPAELLITPAPAAAIMPQSSAPEAQASQPEPFSIEIPLSAPEIPGPELSEPAMSDSEMSPPVSPDAALPLSPPDAGEPRTVQDDPADETAAVAGLRDALKERVPELEREAEAARLQEDLGKAERQSASATRSHAVHLGLILSSLAAVCLALGYLLAPVIERHLNGATSAQTSAAAPSFLHGAEIGKIQPDDLRKMAEQGNPEAQFLLGTLYRSGDGVLQNDNQAVDWFQRAADQGYVRALSALGSSYWSGRGVPQDYSKAYFWYELALAEGDQNSKALLEGLSTQLTSEQVANIRQQAEAWLHAHNQLAKSTSK